MSSVSPAWCCGAQRPPLQPRGAPPSPNTTMKVSGNAIPPSSSQSASSNCKRHNLDSICPEKSENEPLALYSKRQRTKSGSDTMEPSVSCPSWNPLSDCLSNNKGETSPLCERNIRTKTDGSDSVLDPSCTCTPLTNNDRLLSDNNNTSLSIDCVNGVLPERFTEHSSGECEKASCSNNISDTSKPNFTMTSNNNLDVLNINSNTGGYSPHCSSTLEYVAQLPEGCSGNNADDIPDPNLDCSRDSDGELDDDNYLDSSEGEEDDEDNLALTNNEDDESCGEDDQSVISTITVGSTCSLRSIASEAVNTICMNEHGMAANEDGSLLYSGTPSISPLPALRMSLFSHIPPSINFCQYNETAEGLPPTLAKLLKWKFTTITPVIVRKTVTNSGFKITKKTIYWSGTWGKHMKSPCFKTLRDYQKINHFPATFQIGRKDKLWKNFARLQSKFGKEEFGFIPKTFVLPGDVKALKAAFEKEGVKKKWIVKPPASARGTGIQVVNKWSQMPTEGIVVVQRYISRPYLINDTKFDMRIYVLVTSFHPLTIFLYQDGLVRFASVEYNKASKTLNDRYMHLTNYSVNKTSSSYTHNEDAGQCQGHKWTLRTLWAYLKARDVDTGALWSRIADLVIKTVTSGEHDIVIRTRKNIKSSRYSCYELFGFDVILDERLRPWLLEVNISPSLHSASPLDHSVKGPLIADLLNIASFHIPDRISQEQQAEALQELQLGEKVTGLCLDRRLYTRLLTPEEQVKHIQINSMARSQYLSTILEHLTPDDVRHLTVLEDQLQRAGKFTCIYPTPDTHQYFGFLDKPRYYNKLFDAWETEYSSCREKGVERLESLCKDKHHLKVPTRFKMPKVVGSGAGKTTTTTTTTTQRQPSSHQPTQIIPEPSDNSRNADETPPEGEECSKVVDSKSPGKAPQKVINETKINKRKTFRVSVNPLKPAVVTSYLNICSVTRGISVEDEDEEEIYESEPEQSEDNSVNINEIDSNKPIMKNINDSISNSAKLNEDNNRESKNNNIEEVYTFNKPTSSCETVVEKSDDPPLSDNKSACDEQNDLELNKNNTSELSKYSTDSDGSKTLPDVSSVRRKEVVDCLLKNGESEQNCDLLYNGKI